MSKTANKGRIFDIQRFSIHDGPGIRTVVFLKGCPLRCRWCCNPEAQQYEIQKMTINQTVKIVGKDVTVQEVLDEVEKDRPYYRRSGGGITLSGGEALCQPEFAVSLLKACKQIGLHTAMESTGFAKFEIIEQYLPHLDLFLMDIKHMSSQKHKDFTTQPNDLILENAKKIAASQTELIIRTPVIPTFNDTLEEISAIADFASSLPNVKQLHLLPYHRLGENKYSGLGRQYTMTHVQPVPTDFMNTLLQAASKSVIQCQIGG